METVSGYRFMLYVFAGDWFGPSTAAYLLKRCMEDAALTDRPSSRKIFEQMAVYVAQDCTIYYDDVVALCTSNPEVCSGEC